jgi:spore germination protein GerM
MNKRTIALIAGIIIILVLGGIFIVGKNEVIAPIDVNQNGTTTTPTGNTGINPGADSIEVTLYFTDSTDARFQTTCEAFARTTRMIPKTDAVADATLKELFKGPTVEQKGRGLEDLFHMKDEQPLADSYIGVTIKDGTAIVNFHQPAMRYLSSPACMQASIKTSIEKTLKQFSTIKKIEYAIDGKIQTEWDA